MAEGDVDNEPVGGFLSRKVSGSLVSVEGIFLLLLLLLFTVVLAEVVGEGLLSNIVSRYSTRGESSSDLRRGSINSSNDVVDVEALEGAVSLGDVRGGSGTMSAGRTI